MDLAGMEAVLKGFEAHVEEIMKGLDGTRFTERLWKKDPSLWKMEAEQQKIISNSLGWLDSPQKIRRDVENLISFAAVVKDSGIRRVVHMGMGGSSLAPLVLRKTFGAQPRGLPLEVLDSTDPAVILGIERNLPLADTFFIEASKSGTTIESRSLGEYFYSRLEELKASSAGVNFGVITDPGSMLEKLAGERAYRKIFLNYPDIGGRYSALSYFGLVPAALMGINLSGLLERVFAMIRACGPNVPVASNPGAALGAAIGALALSGRNKLTFIIPDAIGTLGMWLEQLIAESTGKEGTGIVPIAEATVGPPEVYAADRLFVEYRIQNETDTALRARVDALCEAGQPVITVTMRDRLDIGAQFFLWEVATATAGAVLRINPFDQPNVQETKTLTGKILEEVRLEGKVPEAPMEMAEGPLRLYRAGGASSVRQALSSFFEQAVSGDYAVLLAYLDEDEPTVAAMEDLRTMVRDRLRIATGIGFGPRYLHSTGQLYKGGPNTGLFVLLTSDTGEDRPIPGQPYTFGMLLRAQALGDFEALRKHKRRVIRVHLAGNAPEGIKALDEALRAVFPRG